MSAKAAQSHGAQTAALLGTALEHHRSGRLAQARACYFQILAIEPKHADALHFMGLLACQLNDRDAGLALIRESIALLPNAIYHNNHGNMLREAGELAQAIDAYRQAVALKHDYAEAHNNLGNALREAGDAKAALDSCAKAIELRPGYAQAYNNLGNALKDLGELEAAAASYEKAIAAKADYAEAYLNLGHVRHAQDRRGDAIECYRSSVAHAPDLAVAHDSLATVLLEGGDAAGAVEHYKQAASLQLDSEEAFIKLGNVLNAAGKLDDAMWCYRHAITLKPDCANAYHNLSNALRRNGRPEEAIVHARRAIELAAAAPSYQNNLGAILADLGRVDEAVECYRKARDLDPDFAESHTCVLFGQSYASHSSIESHLADARFFGERMAARARPYRYEQWPTLADGAHPGRPLRIGFVSADIRMHPVGYFLECALASLDRTRIEPIAYCNSLMSDALTARIKPGFSAWRHVAEMNDQALAKLIHDDRIDILVDLSGHTGFNRLPVFAFRPAPVQVSWLGYFATTGLAEIDYVLVDPHVVPPGEENQFVEQIWRLPDSYLCFTTPDQPVPVAPLPALTAGSITFGCFNNHKKINDTVVSVWARILDAVPSSRLLLKNHQLGQTTMREDTLARFAAHGIGADRLLLEGPSARDEYFAAYHRVDLALDPFPYPGGTTSVEGLWMGVPVLTRRGGRFLEHLGEMVLQTVGLPEWIAADTDDYVARAIAFANDRTALAALRAGLRERVMASPLCDAPRFAAHLASAFEGMWQARFAREASRS